LKKFPQKEQVEKKSEAELEQLIINKIQFQWKTLKKAFIDLNK